MTVDGGPSVDRSFTFGIQTGQQHLVVRTDKPLYAIGDTVKVEVTSTDDGRSVYVDWLNDGQAVDMRTLKAEHGTASFTMNVDSALLGSNRIEAYIVDDDGNVVRAGRTVFARNTNALNVSLATDKPLYAPGEPAKLTFSVKDEQGRPAVAALGVQVVDQAVFALVDAHPGLLRSHFELEDAYAKPHYEIAGPGADFNQLLFAPPSDAAQEGASRNVAKASFAAMGQGAVTGVVRDSWTDVLTEVTANLVPVTAAAKAELQKPLQRVADGIVAELDMMGCKPSEYECKGSQRSDIIQSRFKARFGGFDFWGNPYVLSNNYNGLVVVGKGPDEISGTRRRSDHFFCLRRTQRLSLLHALLMASDNGPVRCLVEPRGREFPVPRRGARGAGGAGGTSSGPSQEPPRVRNDFPETLYVNPAVITGPDGTASVDVHLPTASPSGASPRWRTRPTGGSAAAKVASKSFRTSLPISTSPPR